MSESLVLESFADGVATITLNRPEKLNALSPASFVELRSAIEAAAANDDVGCVILTGAGRAFCAGNDLNAIAAGERGPSRHFAPETIDLLEQMPKPTIAKIRGHCYTGGLELALGCDILFAAESAQLGDTHGQWGLAPSWGMSVRLPERVGRSMAKELMYTARRISGTEAERIGLVDHAVPDDELDAAVDALAAEIIPNSWGTSRIDKALIAKGSTMPRDEALVFERLQPFGVPEDMAERMARPKKG